MAQTYQAVRPFWSYISIKIWSLLDLSWLYRDQIFMEMQHKGSHSHLCCAIFVRFPQIKELLFYEYQPSSLRLVRPFLVIHLHKGLVSVRPWSYRDASRCSMKAHILICVAPFWSDFAKSKICNYINQFYTDTVHHKGCPSTHAFSERTMN